MCWTNVATDETESLPFTLCWEELRLLGDDMSSLREVASLRLLATTGSWTWGGVTE